MEVETSGIERRGVLSLSGKMKGTKLHNIQDLPHLSFCFGWVFGWFFGFFFFSFLFWFGFNVKKSSGNMALCEPTKYVKNTRGFCKYNSSHCYHLL